MERQEAFERLKNSSIVEVAFDTQFSGDFLVGPTLILTVKIRSDWASGAVPGHLNLTLALNKHVSNPLHVLFQFDDVKETAGWMADDADPVTEAENPEEAIMVELTHRIVLLMAMRSVPGYTEHAESLHRAFVSFADV